MERYGSDKPDVRFGMELVELTEVFASTEFRAFQADCVKGIRVEGGADATTRKQLDDLTEQASSGGPRAWRGSGVEDGPTVNSPIAKFLSDDEVAGLVTTMEAEVGDLLFAGGRQAPHRAARARAGAARAGSPAGHRGAVSTSCGSSTSPCSRISTRRATPSRLTIRSRCPTMTISTCWCGGGGEGLLSVRSQAYDLVLNGWELGSGSVRIHRPDIQKQVFSVLGIDDEEAEAKFGFLLDAFRYGAPPHAGFAFGIDRLVALLVGEENIREVIAFPKTQSGADPLTNAPTEIDPRHLDELGLRVLPRAD